MVVVEGGTDQYIYVTTSVLGTIGAQILVAYLLSSMQWSVTSARDPS